MGVVESVGRVDATDVGESEKVDSVSISDDSNDEDRCHACHTIAVRYHGPHHNIWLPILRKDDKSEPDL